MNIKDCVIDAAVIGLSAASLWHFSNIWRYGQHLIQEPNTVLLTLETAGLLLILGFGVTKFVSDLREKRREAKAKLRQKEGAGNAGL